MKRDKSLTWRHVDPRQLDLKGLTVAVIGGTGGIGRSLAHDLAKQGADVLVIGRTFKDTQVRNITFAKADLSLLADARRIAGELPAEKLDLVIMTTGTMAGPKKEVTSEGIEHDLAVSYLSRYVILDEIASRLGRDRPRPNMRARVFIMGFPGSGQSPNVEDLNCEPSYGRIRAHMNTVAGNEALVLNSSKQFPDIDVFGLNPGFVRTGIRSNVFGSKLLLKIAEGLTSFMAIEPEVYAERMTSLLVSPDIEGRSGAMFNNKAEAIFPSRDLAEPSYARAIAQASDQIVTRVLEAA
jgi:NAD(P)-dependent dehydrogenase (short-subunit alcohol dehydrogenase family)